MLRTNKSFSLQPYSQAIIDELSAFGFKVEVIAKDKKIISNIESAFIKADSKKQLIVIEAPAKIISTIHRMQTIKIKMEVDTRPPKKLTTEVKNLLQPIPFAVKTLIPPDLFAGKIHALLCRPWQIRVKGRDWYDFVWYIARNIPVNLIHLRERLIQSNAWDNSKKLTLNDLKSLLKNKIALIDFSIAKNDVKPFVNDPQSIALWTKEFFLLLTEKIIEF